jgi:Putative metal-binding motif
MKKRVLLGSVALLLVLACSAEVSQVPGNSGKSQPPASSAEATDPDAGSAAEPPNMPPFGNPVDAGADVASKKDSESCALSDFYRDLDGDGFGDPGSVKRACVKPSGYVIDKTDCDDTKAAVHPGAPEVCDQVDNNCDGSLNGSASEAAACNATVGTFRGTYTLLTQEKVGATVINSVNCAGTGTFTVDLAKPKVLTGQLACTYSGRLGGFSGMQSATLEGIVLPSGKIEGTITHQFDTGIARPFGVKGTIGANALVITDATNTWRPNPMSAVPWSVELTVSATK